LLTSTAVLLAAPAVARAEILKGGAGLPWRPFAGDPPETVKPGPLQASVDRLIPPDPETPGGKDIGCAVFIDRQLAGPYASAARRSCCSPIAGSLIAAISAPASALIA
jgi:gluconate 2-dehydrogenase gamma chain